MRNPRLEDIIILNFETHWREMFVMKGIKSLPEIIKFGINIIKFIRCIFIDTRPVNRC